MREIIRAVGLLVQETSGVILCLLAMYSHDWFAFGLGAVFVIGARLAHIKIALEKP